MSNEQLQIGDIVRLKSGSYNMTIQSIDSNDMAECTWVRPEGKQTDYFHINTIEKIDPNEQSVWFEIRPKRF